MIATHRAPNAHTRDRRTPTPAGARSIRWGRTRFRNFQASCALLLSLFPGCSDNGDTLITGTKDPEIQISPSGPITLDVGGTAQLTASVSNTSDQSVDFTSNDPDVASVAESGLVTAVAPGTAMVTAAMRSQPDVTDDVQIVVQEPAPTLDIVDFGAMPVNGGQDVRADWTIWKAPDLVAGDLACTLDPGDGSGEAVVDCGEPDAANPDRIIGGFDYTFHAAGTYELRLTVSYAETNAEADATASVTVAPSHTLTVTMSGDGSGTVTSDPAGIDCGAACEATYAEGTTVTLVAEPAEGSLFAQWSGDCSGSATCEVTMDADRTVDAAFVTAGNQNTLELGIFALALVGNPDGIGILADRALRAESSGTGAARAGGNPWPSRWAGPPAAGPAATFGGLPGEFPVAIAGTEGFVVLDLATGQVVLDATGPAAQGVPALGVIGLSEEPPGPTSTATLIVFGQNSFGFYNTDNGFGLEAIVTTPFDAFPAGGDPLSSYAVTVDGAGVNFIYYDADQDIHRFKFFSESGISAARFSGEVVSAWMPDVGTPDDTPVLVLARADESGLYLVERDGSVPAQVAGLGPGPVRPADLGVMPVRVADLGADARKIRCTDDGSGTGDLICAITIFGDDEIAIARWDGENAPTVVGTTAVGDGPVGVDLVALSNGNVAVLTTGFDDHTVTETEVAADGSVVSSETRPAYAGCLAPAHAIYVRDADGLKVVGTCHASGHYFIEESTFGGG